MEGLKLGDLAIDLVEKDAPPSILLTWRGKSNDRFPRKTLGPFFEKVLVQAVARRAAIEMRFKPLEHFNSSTITSVIEMIHPKDVQASIDLLAAMIKECRADQLKLR